MKHLIVIIGATGIGKTDLSIELARYFGTEIISSDSRQVYKELNVGTAVPAPEQLAAVKHHFIGTQSVFDYYNASMFEFEVIALLKKLYSTHNQVLMVGGSGMYVDAVCKGIDDLPSIKPEIRAAFAERLAEEGLESLQAELQKIDPTYYETADIKNPKRVLKALEVHAMTGKAYSGFLSRKTKKRAFQTIKIGLQMEREKLYARIEKRVDIMIENGLVEEARKFLKFKHLNSLNTVGYKELFPYFEGEYSLERAVELIKRNSRRYAKRQISWFNRDKEISWFSPQDKQKIIAHIESEKLKVG